MNEQDRMRQLAQDHLAGSGHAGRCLAEMVLSGQVRADEPHQTRIEKCKDPNFPQFHFEWHPQTGKVYMVEIPGAWLGGEFIELPSAKALKAVVIAEHAEHHARFLGFVQSYLRGYKKAKADITERTFS